MNKIRTHKELKVFQLSFNAAMEIFKMTKGFPKEETYSMTDQIRRSSRSVSANLAESFRKRRYPKHFISKETHDNLFDKYDHIISMLVLMESKPENWSW